MTFHYWRLMVIMSLTSEFTSVFNKTTSSQMWTLLTESQNWKGLIDSLTNQSSELMPKAINKSFDHNTAWEHLWKSNLNLATKFSSLQKIRDLRLFLIKRILMRNISWSMTLREITLSDVLVRRQITMKLFVSIQQRLYSRSWKALN